MAQGDAGHHGSIKLGICGATIKNYVLAECWFCLLTTIKQQNVGLRLPEPIWSVKLTYEYHSIMIQKGDSNVKIR